MVCAINKIDSNVVGLRYAEEECLKELPDVPVWLLAEPNTYPDFGPTYTQVARDFINASRQRRKGGITDLEVAAGWNTDLTATNLQSLMQGFCFASAIVPGAPMVTAADADLVYSANGTAALNATGIGGHALRAGDWVFVGSDANHFPDVHGFARVMSFSANSLVFDKMAWSKPAADQTIGTLDVFLPTAIRNEDNPDLIVRRSYQLERTLGKDNAGTQAEYVKGAIPNQLTLTLQQATKLTADLTFVAMDYETRTGAQGLKAGTRPDLPAEDFINSSTDVVRSNLATIGADGSVNPPLFAFMTEATVVINNNVTLNKAIGTLGGFDASAGNFEVSGAITAYFANQEAAAAIRANADVTADFCMVKDGKGIVVDVPLLTLGNGRLTVAANQAIMIPLDTQAARSSFGHTLGTFFFSQLPALASVPVA